MTRTYAEQYFSLLDDAMAEDPTVNARTGVRVRTLPGNSGQLKLWLNGHRLPVPGNRRYSPYVAAVETAWQVSGQQDASFVMARAPKLWGKFLDDPPPGGPLGPDVGPRVTNAYGYRMRHHFGRDQLGGVVRALQKDPTDRQVYVGLWDPSRDGLGNRDGVKNVPCPVGLHFSLVYSRYNAPGVPDGLALHATLRSSDLFVGLPYDVMNFALLGDLVASSLGTQLRWLAVSVAHGHIYEPQWGVAAECLSGASSWAGPLSWCSLPGWSLETATREPGRYCETVRDLAKDAPQHPYSPDVEVVS
jgi:thymidylate synthase